MAFSIFVCLAAFALLVWLLRRDRISLGLPVAYLFSLLLIHVPGAIAHFISGNLLQDSEFTNAGIAFTAIGTVSFVVGVWLAQSSTAVTAYGHSTNTGQFALFCLAGGWFFTYALSPLRSIPSFGAIIDKAGAVWMLGVMLGLRSAVQRGDRRQAALWLGALAVYPALMLLLGGFLSYGSTAIIVVLSVLVIATRRDWRVYAGLMVAAVLSFHVFLSYFENRDAIRAAVWGGASFEERIDASLSMITDFKIFDAADEKQLTSLDQRLNQNYFAGLAAARIERGDVDYLYGRSVWEGIIAFVPRALWPEKPVVAGSPKVVSEMTGLVLSENTSFGVGNVMEFYINFSIPGVIAGFLLLGWGIGTLDRKAAAAERNGDLGRTILFFLPAIALIQPNGSIVELASGSAAAFLSAYGWMWAWNNWSGRRAYPSPVAAKAARRRL